MGGAGCFAVRGGGSCAFTVGAGTVLVRTDATLRVAGARRDADATVAAQFITARLLDRSLNRRSDLQQVTQTLCLTMSGCPVQRPHIRIPWVLQLMIPPRTR